MNTSSFPPPLPLQMLFPPPPQIQCHRYSAGLAAFPIFFPSLCSLCYINFTNADQAAHPIHSPRVCFLCATVGQAVLSGPLSHRATRMEKTALPASPASLGAGVKHFGEGVKVMGRDRAMSTNETAQVKKNNIKMTWSWLPRTHCTIHFRKRSVFPSRDDPWKARRLPPRLPPNPGNAHQAPKKRQIISPAGRN